MFGMVVWSGTAYADDASAEDARTDEPVSEADPTTKPMSGDGVPPQSANLWDIPGPSFGLGFSFYFAVDGIDSDWDDELIRFGRPELIPVVGDLGTRVHAYFEGFELSLVGGLLFDVRDSGGDPRTSLLAGSVFGELSYDLFRAAILTVGPSFGVGWTRSSFCVAGDPRPVEEAAPTFRQVLAAPGDSTCMHADAMLVRPGLVIGVAGHLSDSGADSVGFFNLRPTYSFVVEQTAYSVDGIQDFEGPTLPHPSIGVALEVGLTFGAGPRMTGI